MKFGELRTSGIFSVALACFSAVLEGGFMLIVVMFTREETKSIALSWLGSSEKIILFLVVYLVILVAFRVLVRFKIFALARGAKHFLRIKLVDMLVQAEFLQVAELEDGEMGAASANIDKISSFIEEVDDYIPAFFTSFLLLAFFAYLFPLAFGLFLVTLIVFAFAIHKRFELSGARQSRFSDDRKKFIENINGLRRAAGEIRLGVSLRNLYLNRLKVVQFNDSMIGTIEARKQSAFEGLSFLSIAGFAALLIISTLSDTGQGSSLLSSLVIVVLVLPNLMTMSGSYSAYAEAKAAYKKLTDLSKPAQPLANHSNNEKLLGNIKAIEFRRVVAISADGEFISAKVDLVVQRGEVTIVSGANGSGKSTLLRSIIGLTKFHEGAAYCVPEIGDAIQTNQEALIKLFSYASANQILDHLSPDDQLPQEFEHNASQLQFSALKSRDTVERIVGLSSGEQARLQLIFAMSEGKDFIALDEPCANQSPEFKKYFYKRLLPTVCANGVGAIVISHDTEHLFGNFVHIRLPTRKNEQYQEY